LARLKHSTAHCPLTTETPPCMAFRTERLSQCERGRASRAAAPRMRHRRMSPEAVRASRRHVLVSPPRACMANIWHVFCSLSSRETCVRHV
jgi:hypothetical protein